MGGVVIAQIPTEYIYNICRVVCKFYDGHVVKVSTGADRFTIRVPTDELLWVATRVRAQLIARELATADEQ